MNDVQQPGARLQYADWKRWPKTYREPTHDEWVRDYDSLTADLAAAQARMAQLEGALRETADEFVEYLEDNEQSFWADKIRMRVTNLMGKK